MNFLLKHQVKEVSEELKSIEYEFSLTKDKINLQQKYIEDIKKNKKVIIEEKQEELIESKKLIDQQNKDILKLQEDIKPLEDALKDKEVILKSVKEFNKMEAKLSNRVDENERQKKFFEDNDECPTCTQTIEQELKETKIKEKTNRILELKDGITKLEQQLNEKEKRLTELNLVGTTMRTKEVDIAKANASISQLKKFIEQSNRQLQEYTKASILEEDNIKLVRLNERLKINEEQITKLREDKFYVDVARNLLMDTGIKTKIINQYLPIMNKLINGYLTSMDFYVNFTLDNNFQETIKSRHRDEFSYASFSEGEKMRIDLALLFTWRAVAKMKNSTNTNLLILDEIFDSSLDTTGTDDFLKILKTFTDQNVFVISHKGDTMFDKFRNIIRFEKQRNFSKLF